MMFSSFITSSDKTA